jgi:hypothetical protein
VEGQLKCIFVKDWNDNLIQDIFSNYHSLSNWIVPSGVLAHKRFNQIAEIYVNGSMKVGEVIVSSPY